MAQPFMPPNPWSAVPKKKSAEEQFFEELAAMQATPAPSRSTQMAQLNPAPGVTDPRAMHEANANAAMQRSVPRPVRDGSAAPQAKGSGGTSDAEEEDQFKRQGTLVQSVPRTAKEWQALIDMARKTPAYMEQEGGIEGMRGLLEMQNNIPVHTDISPLAMMMSPERAKMFLGTYNKPEGATEIGKRAFEGASKLQDDRRDLMKSAMEAAGKMTAGTATDLYSQILKSNLGQKFEDPSAASGRGAGNSGRHEAQDLKWVVNRYMTDPQMKPKIESLASLSGMEADLSAENWVGNATIPGRLGKAAGFSPLSIMDIRMMQSPPDVVSKLENLWSRLVKGEIHEDEREAYLTFALLHQEKAMRELKEGATHYAQVVAPAFNLDPKKAGDVLDPSWRSRGNKIKELLSKIKPGAPRKDGWKKHDTTTTTRTKALEDMTEAELDAYEAKLKGK